MVKKLLPIELNTRLNIKTYYRLAAFTLCFSAIPAQALPIIAEPGSNYHKAQHIEGKFDLSFNADIGDVTGANTSTRIPHATIDASNAGYGLTHWYSFGVARPSTVILDIDYGAEYIVTGGEYPYGITDTVVSLYDRDLNIISQNDDHSPMYGPIAGAGGSIFHYDSFIETILDDGFYYVAVSQFLNTDFTANNGYVLQLSISHPVPGPPGTILILMGLGAFCFARLRVSDS